MKSLRNLSSSMKAAVPVLSLGCASALGSGDGANQRTASGEPPQVLAAASARGNRTSAPTSTDAHPRTSTAGPATFNAAPAASPSQLAPAQSQPDESPTIGISASEAQSIAERELRRFDTLFSKLSLEPSTLTPEAYRFALKGRSAGVNDLSTLGFLLVYGDHTVGFQELDGGDVMTVQDGIQRERKRRLAISAIYRLPEVRAFCKLNAPRCTTFIESSPAKGCVPEDSDRRQCAWGISIRTLQGLGTDFLHATAFATFYVREDGELFVEPVETGEVVRIWEWRCLRGHNFEMESCPGK